MVEDMVNESARVLVLQQTTCHMLGIGFQASQKGYRYLREAVWIAYSRPETLHSVTKLLYPEIAKLFSTTDKQVERAIRAAIETAWIKGQEESIRSLFEDISGNGRIRPTNKVVIERLAGSIKGPTDSEED